MVRPAYNFYDLAYSKINLLTLDTENQEVTQNFHSFFRLFYHVWRLTYIGESCLKMFIFAQFYVFSGNSQAQVGWKINQNVNRPCESSLVWTFENVNSKLGPTPPPHPSKRDRCWIDSHWPPCIQVLELPPPPIPLLLETAQNIQSRDYFSYLKRSESMLRLGAQCLGNHCC